MARQLNILLILTDQQRFDSLGCYGASGVHTPHLDQLAAEGIRYDRCYVNTPICTPSRACLWTGKHILGHGVHAIHDCLPEDEVLFSKRLQARGYRTSLFGKLHVSGHYREEERRHSNDGFDVYEWANDPFGPWGMNNAYLEWLEVRNPEQRRAISEGQVSHIAAESHMTTWAAERTIDYLRQTGSRRHPFFCCMSMFDPHSPYVNYPRDAEALLDVASLPSVVAGDEGFDHRPIAHAMEPRWNVPVPPAETLAQWRLGYHAAVAHIDRQVGRVLAAIDDLSLRENTAVVFTSDHGDMLGDHGLMTKGGYFYDACTRVPMIVRAPGVLPRREPAPVQLHDVAATCLGFAGQDAADTVDWSPDGISLMDSDRLAARNRAVCLYRNSGNCSKPETGYQGPWDPPIHGTMWLRDGLKTTLYHSPAADPNVSHPRGEMYDLADDPHEIQSRWADPTYEGRRDAMTMDVMDWLAHEEVRARSRGEDASGDRSTAGR